MVRGLITRQRYLDTLFTISVGLVLPLFVAGVLCQFRFIDVSYHPDESLAVYIVQPRRFGVFEEVGCVGFIDNSVLFILLIDGWPVVLPLISATVYCRKFSKDLLRILIPNKELLSTYYPHALPSVEGGSSRARRQRHHRPLAIHPCYRCGNPRDPFYSSGRGHHYDRRHPFRSRERYPILPRMERHPPPVDTSNIHCRRMAPGAVAAILCLLSRLPVPGVLPGGSSSLRVYKKHTRDMLPLVLV